MARDEDKILHGLYYAREIIGEKLTYSGNQIWWLTTQSFTRGAEWTKGGYPKSVDPAEDLNGPRFNETRFNLVTAQQERPLRLLVADGLIEWRNHDLVTTLGGRPGHAVEVAVTNAGAKRALRLHTWWGRSGLWYEEHKGGLLFAVGGALVAAAAFVTHHFWK